MTEFNNNNNKFINTPKTYEQFVLEEQQEQNQVKNKDIADSYDAETNAYGNLAVEKGYGPCRNALCGCNCSSNICTCSSFSCETKNAGAGFSGVGRKTEAGAAGIVNAHMCHVKEKDIEGRIMSLNVGGEVGVIPGGVGLKGKLGVDAINIKSDGIQANIGLNVDTGIKVDSDGAEVTVVGVGVEIGSNKFGIRTPFGGFSLEW